jgi:TldD protein
MEDPKNWGIQCWILYGREIKDGEITNKIFSPILMTGYVPDLLNSISMISDDLELSGVGSCGKGHKEFVKVSSGGPYIKAKARLG